MNFIHSIFLFFIWSRYGGIAYQNWLKYIGCFFTVERDMNFICSIFLFFIWSWYGGIAGVFSPLTKIWISYTIYILLFFIWSWYGGKAGVFSPLTKIRISYALYSYFLYEKKNLPGPETRQTRLEPCCLWVQRQWWANPPRTFKT